MFKKYSDALDITLDDLANTDKMHYKDVELLHLIAYSRNLLDSKDLLNFFFDKGHGMMVSYIQEQKKFKDKFIGHGIVMLRTKSLLVRLTISGATVIQIETNNTDMFISMSGLVNEKVRFMKLEFDSSFYQGLVYISSNVMMNCHGTKFVETPLTNHRLFDYEKLVIVPEHMKITTYQRIGNRLVPISSLKTHDMCISNIDSDAVSNSWVEAWCEMTSIPPGKAISLLKSTINYSGWESEFLKMTFAKRYGFRHSHMTNLPTVIDNMSTRANICEMDIIKNALDAIGNLDFLQEIVEESVESTLDDVDNFPIDLFSSSHTFDTTVLEHYKESYMALHPMWDKLIMSLNPRLVEKGHSTDQAIAIVHEVIYGRKCYKEVESAPISWRSGK
jgi:hypothetical protein